MKRYSIVVLLLMFFNIIICSQNMAFFANEEVLEKTAPEIWSCGLIYCNKPMVHWFDYVTLFTHGDTIIADKKYKQLFYFRGATYRDSLILDIVGELQDSVINKEKQYICAIRYSEDKNKMYCYSGDQEYLLFDFSLKKGDKCDVISGIEINIVDADVIFEDKRPSIDVKLNLKPLNLSVIDELDQDGLHLLKLSELSNPDNQLYQTTWIDGIGSLYGLLSIPEGGVTCSTVPALICAWNNEDKLYEITDENLLFWDSEVYSACPMLGMLTNVEAVVEYSDDSDAPIYNILGQQVGKNYRGIVIKNGKKYLKL